MTHYTANDLYDMFANQADAASIAATSTHALALDLAELDTDGAITDYTAAAEAVQAIAADLAARSAAAAVMGSATSERKAAAARANGAAPVKEGSRPRGRPRKQPATTLDEAAAEAATDLWQPFEDME